MSASHKKHDVFINFRGEDTRKTFIGHLEHALRKEAIKTYVDYNINKGNEVWPELEKAIQDSHISLVVFSENYADSKWCLDELVKIMECREHHGQVVIPVFYEIDPTQIRHQTVNYERAFAKYQKGRSITHEPSSYEDKVSNWEKALAAAANLSGWVSGSGQRDDSQLLKNIVKDVSEKLSLMYPNELIRLVENDGKIGYIESFVINFPKIGIWGMPGIGKTTIARQMFVKRFAKYDSACFLENVREEIKNFGLPYVRTKLVGELLKQPITTTDIVAGASFIKRRLSSKNVFVVLDDVDNFGHLEYLVEDLYKVGPNSRIIITTRDKRVLGGIVNWIYEVPEWKLEESLELFSLGAFKQKYPKEGYERFSKRAVEYAGGVPLALKVLGSHFCSIDPNPSIWKDELNYLKNTREWSGEIQQALKVSYNGLTPREKEIFLDIAFFFKDETKDFVTRILDASIPNATRGIQILEDKALITISKSNNRIQMHDLLHKMASDIDPMGKHSRLRDFQEVHDVLRNIKGEHNKVEGIIFDLSQEVTLHVQADTFNKMTDLKFLKLYVPMGKKRLATMYLDPQVMIGPFSNKLRYLEWNGYPLKSLPPPFCAELLVEIHLPNSNIEHLWHGTQVRMSCVEANFFDLTEIHLMTSHMLEHCPFTCTYVRALSAVAHPSGWESKSRTLLCRFDLVTMHLKALIAPPLSH